ncbi:MAG: hypothetical protein ACLU30_13880 [Odoribacter splanchnicus]
MYDVTKLTDTTQPMVLCSFTDTGEVCKPDSYLFSVKVRQGHECVEGVFTSQPQEVKVTSLMGNLAGNLRMG